MTVYIVPIPLPINASIAGKIWKSNSTMIILKCSPLPIATTVNDPFKNFFDQLQRTAVDGLDKLRTPATDAYKPSNRKV